MQLELLKTENNKVKMNVKGAKPKIMITVPLKFEILSNPSMVNFAKSKKNRQILKEHLADHMKTMNEKFFKKITNRIKRCSIPFIHCMLENILERFRNIKNLIGQKLILKQTLS